MLPPPRTRRRWLVGLVTAMLIAILPLQTQAASESQVIINASGGDAGEPGLRIHYANGQLQVYRDGISQLYPDVQLDSPPSMFVYNAIALHLDGVAYSPTVERVPGFLLPTPANQEGPPPAAARLPAPGGQIENGSDFDNTITTDSMDQKRSGSCGTWVRRLAATPSRTT